MTPKVVERIRDTMPTFDRVKKWTDLAGIDPKDMNILSTQMKAAMTPDQKKAYKTADRDAKAAWISQYLVDPKAGIVKGFNCVTAKLVKDDLSRWRWLHESEIAKELNSEPLAKLLCESGQLDSRPSEFKALADAGHRQHHFNSKEYTDSKRIEEAAGVETVTELKPEEYEAVGEHMKKSFESVNPPLKRKAPTPKKAPESAESHNFKKAKIQMAQALRCCKKNHGQDP